MRCRFHWLVGFSCSVLAGCVLAPHAAEEQRAAVARAAVPYRAPFAERDLPALPAAPTWRDVVRRALAASGDVEAAYFDWAAAVHRIDRAGAYPNSAFSLDVSRALSGSGSAFDRTSLALGFDPMENLAFPTKVYQAAKVATADAQVAEQRLVAARFDIQRRALGLWNDFALGAERLRLTESAAALTRVDARAAAARVAAGASSSDVWRAEQARQIAESEVVTLGAAQVATRARLNGLLGRAAEEPLLAPAALEASRTVPNDDAWLLAIAAEHDATLAALARDVAGREDALVLARQQYIPDFNPFVGTEGAASQVAGMVVSIPTMLREVGAMVEESRANLRATTARYRQARFDRGAAVVAALVMLRDAERRHAVLAGPVRRVVEEAAASAARAYVASDGSSAETIAARRMTLDVAGLSAEAWAARENAVADLEALLGVDVETLAAAERRAPVAGRAAEVRS